MDNEDEKVGPRQTVDDGPRRVMVIEAGERGGKHAMMARWADELRARGEKVTILSRDTPPEKVVTWADLMQFAKTGCGLCHGAGYVASYKANERGAKAEGAKANLLRCSCTDYQLRRRKLALVSRADGSVVLRKVE